MKPTGDILYLRDSSKDSSSVVTFLITKEECLEGIPKQKTCRQTRGKVAKAKQEVILQMESGWTCAQEGGKACAKSPCVKAMPFVVSGN